MKRFILVCLIITAAISTLSGECEFKVGERFEYKVKLNFIKAGKAFIELKDMTTIRGDSVYHIISKTRTTGFLDRLFHIREHMESWVDCDSLFSRKFYKDVDEVNYEKTFHADFFYQDSIVKLNKDKEKPITGPVMDWLSLIYYLRNVELYEGQELKMTFFDNNKLKDYSAYVVGRETIELDDHAYLCWIIEPSERAQRDMKHKNKLTIYLSVNQPIIPVKITNKAKFGTMILELKR